MDPLRIGEAKLQLLTTGDVLRGFGRVTIGDQELRSPRLPWLVDIRTPEALEFTDWRIQGAPLVDGGVDLVLVPAARQGDTMEWMLHTVKTRRRLADWADPATRPLTDTTLTIKLRPVTRTIAGQRATGFSYQYLWASASHAIYRILDRASWEPGGHAEGLEFWQRTHFVPAGVHVIGGPDEHLTTEWWLAGCHNPDVVQFIPYQTGMQGFTCTRSSAGALITWATTAAHIRSLFEKRRGTDEMLHFHEHCGDLSRTFATCATEVLWLDGPCSPHAAINQYEAVRELVWSALHADAGVRREYVSTYGVVEEWGVHDFARSTVEALPALCAHGVEWVMIPNHFANNMNTWGVGNMCCTVDYKVPDSVGVTALTDFCTAAKANGMQVEMWGNTALSTLTWIFSHRDVHGQEIDRIRFLPTEGSVMEAYSATCQAFIRNPAGHIESDHYTPAFACTNLRDPVVTAYWHTAWRDLHERIGVDGLFLDSSANLSSDKFHWIAFPQAGMSGATIDQTALHGRIRPAAEPERQIQSMYLAHLGLVREMQSYGYRYTSEDCGLFGVNRSGPSVKVRGRHPWMWSETICYFEVPEIEQLGLEPDDVFVRGLAFRMMWYLYWRCDTGIVSFIQYPAAGSERWDRPTAFHIARYRAFAQADQDMRGQRTVLADDARVLYRSGATRVLWAFRDQSLEVPAEDLIHGGQMASAVRHGVYRWVVT